VGALVTYDGEGYTCRQAHTSQPDWTPDVVPALWTWVDCDDGGDDDGGDDDGGDDDGGDDDGGHDPPDGLVFSPYKDTCIHMDWNTNVISTQVSGSATPLATDLPAHGAATVTLAFATGECGSESWGGVPGDVIVAANLPLLTGAGIDYIVSTGGAAGAFRCATDAGFRTFIDRWDSPNLIGIDLDIEAGQSQADILALVRRVHAAHADYPGLRFSLTLATLANNDGAPTAHPLGPGVPDSFNIHGVWAMQAMQEVFGFDGTAATWPSYVTVNLMTMDYGAPGPGVCVVSGGTCDMGQSAIQAAYNLRDHWGVPLSNVELTPMIGGNDIVSEQFTLADVDVMSGFAIDKGLAGVHYWSYDRDVDCPPGPASPICNSLGGVGRYGFLDRFLTNGLR